MDLDGAVCVVTGGGNGIGAALCRRFATAGAKGVVVADLDADGAQRVAAELPNGTALAGDVTDPAYHQQLVAAAEERYGPVDLYCSNAGTGAPNGLDATLDEWQRVWEVNLLSHVHAAKAVLPSMLARHRGYLLQTASAAGLLTNLGDATYTASKHAAVGLAEWLSATYRHQGIGVSVLCPMGVDTDLLKRASEGVAGQVVTGAGAVLTPEQVADDVVAAIAAEEFLILPHPEVKKFMAGKVADPDRWLTSMNAIQQQLEGQGR